MRLAILVAALVLSAGAGAHPHTASECREGGDFIRNAALSRDRGASREFLLNRLEEDFAAIRGFPPALRWFVQDEDDERFLRAELEAVFDSPQASEVHRMAFVERCLARAGRLSPSRT